MRCCYEVGRYLDCAIIITALILIYLWGSIDYVAYSLMKNPDFTRETVVRVKLEG